MKYFVLIFDETCKSFMVAVQLLFKEIEHNRAASVRMCTKCTQFQIRKEMFLKGYVQSETAWLWDKRSENIHYTAMGQALHATL